MLLAKLRLPLLGLLSALALSGASGLAPRPSVGLAASPPSPSPLVATVHFPKLPPLPAEVQQAVDALKQGGNGPDWVADISSIDVKYVTATQFFDAIHGAWKHADASECNTFTGSSGELGHVYAVAMHGNIVYTNTPGGTVASSNHLEVLIVQASDARPDPSIPLPTPFVRPGLPAPIEVVQTWQDPGPPPLGPDGEPLCWSSLPSS